MDIGKRLRELREAKGYSQGSIEKRTGLLRYYISRVECGHSLPSLGTLEKWAKALDLGLYSSFAKAKGNLWPPRSRSHHAATQEKGRSSSSSQRCRKGTSSCFSVWYARLSEGGRSMSNQDKRVTVGVEELALSNAITLNALVELLEEKGVVSKQEVLGRIKRLQEQARKPN